MSKFNLSKVPMTELIREINKRNSAKKEERAAKSAANKPGLALYREVRDYIYKIQYNNPTFKFTGHISKEDAAAGSNVVVGTFQRITSGQDPIPYAIAENNGIYNVSVGSGDYEVLDEKKSLKSAMRLIITESTDILRGNR